MTKQAEIYYFTLTDEMLRTDKLAWFGNTKFKQIEFDKIIPDDKGNWINLTDNDFESLMPVCDKEVKGNKSQQAIFKLFSLGVVTARDEWVYDDNKENLIKKVEFLIDIYNQDVEKHQGKSKEDIRNSVDYSIKWSRAVKNDLEKGVKYKFNDDLIVDSIYRQFIKKHLYFSKQLNEMQYQISGIFGLKIDYKNKFISITFHDQLKYPSILSGTKIWDYGYGARDSTALAIYSYDKDGNRHDNITDWALNQFKSHYQTDLTKQDIFHYVYAVLHNPQYREKYELNLKREFPRIPYYENFAQWAEWGKQLMNLHLNYESIAQFPLERHDTAQAKIPKAKLKADKEKGLIILDDNTHLSGIPLQAWEYKLGNRSALEWILDQYKEKKPKDPTIAEKFNNYRFADYKEQVIDLLMRVCTVSVKTMQIVKAFEN